MNKREAETLVETVLTQPYAETDLRKLVVNIFPDLEPKSDRWTGAYIPEAFRDGVAQYSRLGKVEDAEGYTIDILAVKLKNAATLERARTLQRNFVARYLNGGRGGELRDAALVAFYADGTADWRFSLVRMDYTLDPERNKVRKELTPARRYSFLVGGDEKTHTAQKQLATLLQGNAETTLGELEKAFNIESVTKEFFERYKALFLNLKEELDALEQRDPRIRQEFADKTIDTATFAKRLLGQIVFLYFLQKKGWLGVGRNADGNLEPWGHGPKDFLRRLFEQRIVSYQNFFDELLEPLFYEALASDRGEASYYSRFECRIPFLNGGLFEPVGGYNWQETRINLRNETFAQIFATFDLYNFTVREDEPLDKEVAVDPEMLGKVFENLLDVTDRKSKGAFYTPREIVHYMCQESLINYLDTALNIVTRPLVQQTPTQDDLFGRPQTRQAPLTEDVYEERVPRTDIEAFVRLGDAAQEHDATTTQKGKETDAYRFRTPESIRRSAGAIDAALTNIKICDPAIGSGAFPVGMMNEIVRTRLALNAHISAPERSAYDFKRHAIQESIYGVDIEESAVDIAKLRLWLSLIVDEDDFGTIKPLPNLEYKIVIGNSLLGVEETLFNNKTFETLARLQHDYIGETRPGQKRDLKNRIDALIGELTNDSERFDFKIYFSEVFRQKGGFDVVIGNPPYLRIQGIRSASPKLVDQLKKRFKSATGSYDLYVLFVEQGLFLLHKQGQLNFIMPAKWVNAAFGKGLRGLVAQNGHLMKLISFGAHQIFNASTYTSLLWLSKERQQTYSYFEYEQDLSESRELEKALSTLANEHFNFSDGTSLNDQVWTLTNKVKGTVIKKLKNQARVLSQAFRIFTGLQTSSDSVYFLSKCQESDNYIEGFSSELGTRVSIEKGLLKPLLKGNQVHRFVPLTTKNYVVFPYELSKNGASIMSPEFMRESFPRGWQYIINCEEVIKGREKGSIANSPEWYKYIYPKNLSLFAREKLVSPDISKGGNFSFDVSGKFYQTTTVYGYIRRDEVEEEYQFWQGIMNSTLLWFYLKNTGTVLANGYFRYKPAYLNDFPVPKLNFSDPADKQKHDAVVGLVETMLSLHEQKAATTDPSERAHLEREIAATDAQIDRLVYRLYELSEEEIRIVEGGV